MSALDEPTTKPTLNVTFEFPEGHSDEQILAGHDMAVSLTASYLTDQQIVSLLLRLAETLTTSSARDRVKQESTALAPLSDEVIEALAMMNARIAMIEMVTEMRATAVTVMGFGL